MNDRGAKLPPLSALRAFEAAARHASFVAAADELCVTPAAISHQIRGLEETLGVTLFRRTNRRVILTDQGQALQPQLRQAFGLIEQAVSSLARSIRREVLTISATPAFTAKWLLPRIHLFQAKHPEVDIRLDASPELEDLTRGEVDVAIRFGSGVYPGLESTPLRPGVQENVFPVCSPSLLRGENPLAAPSDLLHHTLLHDDSLNSDSGLPNWRNWFEAAEMSVFPEQRGLRFNNSVLAIEAAINGQGVALSCGFVVADELAAGRLVRPFEIPCRLDYNYFVIHTRNNRSRDKLEKFKRWLIAMCDIGSSEQKNPSTGTQDS